MLHPLIEARRDEAQALVENMTYQQAVDLDCGTEYARAVEFLRDLQNGAYAGGNVR